ncbi:DUF998 domain-containing protein [Candidatus Bathyarchaeota archaeon]|nr:DUF998 domain-containing protein [Candidatus Bathyarchaeota archaeon]
MRRHTLPFFGLEFNPTKINVIFARTQSQVMDYDNKKVAGLLFVVAVVQYVLVVVISESIYSGYSVGQQYLSDLGDWSVAGNNAAIFNGSALLWGIFLIAGAYFIQQIFKNRLFTSLLAISGVGAVVSAVVSLNISFEVHGMFGLVAFVFGAASAIVSYKLLKSPLCFISIILGAVTLSATVLFMLGQGNSDFYLGLGVGGIERFVVYPFLLWMLGFGAYLIGDSSNKE